MSDDEHEVDELDTLDDGLPPISRYHLIRLECQQLRQEALKPFTINCFNIIKEIGKLCGKDIKHIVDFKYVKWNDFVENGLKIKEVLVKNKDVLKSLFLIDLDYKPKCVENRNLKYMRKMLKKIGYKIIKNDVYMSIKKS